MRAILNAFGARCIAKCRNCFGIVEISWTDAGTLFGWNKKNGGVFRDLCTIVGKYVPDGLSGVLP